MDAFEQLVSEILWIDGYWARTSVKVELTREEKREIKRHSSPRWELDVVAYRGSDNILRVAECKSFLDSIGVQQTGFDSSTDDSKRYKLFNEPDLRRVIFNRLRQQFAESGACRPDAEVRLALVCGKIKESSRSWLREHFQRQDWDLWDEVWLKEKLQRMSKQSYENQVSTVVSKLLLRGKVD
jgi:hypothetical protein